MKLARMNRVIERIMRVLKVDRPTAALIAAILTGAAEGKGGPPVGETRGESSEGEECEDDE